MDQDYEDLALIRQEAMRGMIPQQQQPPRAQSKASNPFRLAGVTEVFGGKERQKLIRDEERHSMLSMSLVQRADLQKPTIPSCVTTKPRPPDNEAEADEHSVVKEPERSRRMTEFVREKREIFLMQMLIDQQKKEIARIQREIKQAEEGAVREEEGIEQESKDCKTANTKNEATLARRRRKVEVAAKKRVEREQALKRSRTSVSWVNNEIAKNQDLLEAYQIFKKFMVEVTPEGNTMDEYFDQPRKMTECLDALESANFGLIQSCLHLDDKVGNTTEGLTQENEQVERMTKKIESEMPDVDVPFELPDDADEMCVIRGKIQDAEYERLRAMVENAFMACYGRTADIAPIGMLQQIEMQLEEYYRKIDFVKPEFIQTKQQQFAKLRREEARRDKQLKQEAEQKQKMDHAIARANKPIQKRCGRPLMKRMMPFRAEAKDDGKRLAALLEQQRIDRLLYGDDND